MDTKAMEKAGFFVAPDKVPTLAGAPTHTALEITVTLQVCPMHHSAAVLDIWQSQQAHAVAIQKCLLLAPLVGM